MYPIFGLHSIENRTISLIEFHNESEDDDQQQVDEFKVWPWYIFNFWSILLLCACVYLILDPITSTAGWLILILIILVIVF